MQAPNPKREFVRRCPPTLVVLIVIPLACERGNDARSTPAAGAAPTTAATGTPPADAERRASSAPAAAPAVGRASDDATDDADADRILSLPYAGVATVKPGEEDLKGVLIHDPTRCYPGYTLYSLMYQSGGADLISADGAVVKKWRRPVCRTWMHAELLPNGDLLAVGTEPINGRMPPRADDARHVYRFSWEGELLWKVRLAAHHDIEVNPEGKLLTVVNKRRRLPAISPASDVVDDELTLLSADGRVLESASLYDIVSAKPQMFPFRWRRLDSAELFHTNSVEWMSRRELFGTHPLYDPQHVLVSIRNESRIAIIHWDRKELVWVWGAGNQIDAQHDATLLENGHILVFDNGVRQKWSRVVEVDPIAGQVVWEYKAPVPQDFYSRSRGGAQRLPNGNTLIANSDSGEILEITADGTIVWRFVAPYAADFGGKRVTINRAHRHEAGLVEGLLGGRPTSQAARGGP